MRTFSEKKETVQRSWYVVDARDQVLGRLASRVATILMGKHKPTYVDFLHVAFVIGMTSQTADVDIASRSMRRIALVHGVIAFFFNTTLLAITINIAAGLI